MKKLWLFFMMTLMPLWASADVAINEENFPDENFRVFLKEQPYGQDGIITKKEINTITKIDVSYKEIKSLEGVEFFTILDNLNCNYNQLTSLDVSKNTALKELTCDGNQLTSLDVSNNLALKSLYCGGNLLTSLDVSKNMALTWLECRANQLTSLDVSNNTALMYLDCYNNQLASLDVSKNTALGELMCDGNQLTSLDVTRNSALKNLYCSNNQLTSLDVSKNTSLTSLYCHCNQIKGEMMDDLVSTLPIQNKALLLIIELNNTQEGNICTKDQVKIAKERGWRVITSSWDDYEGHDPLRDVAINEENFPDENFRAFLKEQPYGVDGVIIDDEINFITEIVVSQKEIKSLKGIEFFTKLKSLYCSYNPLTSLDVSKNTALTWLVCIYNNQMTSLDVSKNTALTWLDCKHNQLTSLDVSGCTDLRTLDCSNNKIANLDLSISNNTALTFLYCYGNKIKGEAMDALVESLPNQSSAKITVIDLSNSSEENVCTTIQVNTAKEKGWKVYSYNLVNIYGNIYTSEVEYEGSDPVENDITISEENFPDENFRAYLMSQSYGKDGIITEEEIKNVVKIDVSRRNITNLKGIEYFTALTDLNCSNNQLTSLDVAKNNLLKKLYCIYNQLTSLDVSMLTHLEELFCSSNKLASLNVSNNTLLSFLGCAENQLSFIDVSKNTILRTFWCGNNVLRNLDISKNLALAQLSCEANLLESLDVSNNRALYSLICGDNQLSCLDVSKNTALNFLGCYGNGLSSLDLSKNVSLTSLYCGSNQLTTLDLSNNTSLTNFDCQDNHLQILDVTKNILLESLLCANNKINTLDISKNTFLTNLFCITNQMIKLIVSKDNKALKTLYCSNNQIKGEAMDALVNNLPIQEEASLYVISLASSNECNVCTTIQVNKANEKGWKVFSDDGKDYKGSTPAGIQGIMLDKNMNISIYDLNGRILKKPSKGFNIIDGKKVVVK